MECGDDTSIWVSSDRIVPMSSGSSTINLVLVQSMSLMTDACTGMMGVRFLIGV